ncbi:MAG: hypothetical protein JNK85_06810 [Verrucomicrobiales bacterium]|nr:hypothetical protein [Verrucomicrobiales bacterium]
MRDPRHRESGTRNDATAKILDDTTHEDLLEQERQLSRSTPALDFLI